MSEGNPTKSGHKATSSKTTHLSVRIKNEIMKYLDLTNKSASVNELLQAGIDAKFNDLETEVQDIGMQEEAKHLIVGLLKIFQKNAHSLKISKEEKELAKKALEWVKK